jgi:hypothetical protein
MKFKPKTRDLVLVLAIIVFSSIPFVIDVVHDPLVVNTSPLTKERHILAYYYPWFGNSTTYTNHSRGIIDPSENRSINEQWRRWVGYSYTAAPNLTTSQAYYWKYGGQRNYSWASVAHWPKDGMYDTADPSELYRHYDRAQKAGIDTFICDATSPYEDEFIYVGDMLAIANERSEKGLYAPNITILFGAARDYAKERPGKTAPEAIYEYLSAFLDTYGSHPCFFKVNGKPVLFTWATYVNGVATWREVMRLLRQHYEFYMIADFGYYKPGPPGTDWIDVFDGFHFYNPVGYLSNTEQPSNVPNKYANLPGINWTKEEPDNPNHGVAPPIVQWGEVVSPTIRTMYRNMKRYYDGYNKLWGPTVIPGYDDRQIYPHAHSYVGRDRTMNYGTRLTYDGMWEDAIACSPCWVFICSFNEIHEGTEIDVSVEYGDLFINRTAYYTGLFH